MIDVRWQRCLTIVQAPRPNPSLPPSKYVVSSTTNRIVNTTYVYVPRLISSLYLREYRCGGWLRGITRLRSLADADPCIMMDRRQSTTNRGLLPRLSLLFERIRKGVNLTDQYMIYLPYRPYHITFDTFKRRLRPDPLLSILCIRKAPPRSLLTVSARRLRQGRMMALPLPSGNQVFPD